MIKEGEYTNIYLDVWICGCIEINCISFLSIFFKFILSIMNITRR